MTAYAIGHLRDVRMGPEIEEYLSRIDETLAPFGGRFLLHGSRVEVLEGSWRGDLIIIEFPDIDRARAWYASAAYRSLLPLRTRNATGEVILATAVPPGYRAADLLRKRSGPTLSASTVDEDGHARSHSVSTG